MAAKVAVFRVHCLETIAEEGLFEGEALKRQVRQLPFAQRRGSPHKTVPDLCQRNAETAILDELGLR
jgi:hypothetical protein